MSAFTALLPPDTDLGFRVGRLGPTRGDDFEGWRQDPDNPFELIEGWVVPASPGTFRAGRAALRLATVLERLADERGWSLAFDARHRLPAPAHTVVFPDLAMGLRPHDGCRVEPPLPLEPHGTLHPDTHG